MNRITLRELP